MEDRDDWKLGDEGEPVRCPRCGKPNRSGLSYCTICGNALAEGIETDPEALRTIGEAMGGGRPRRAPEDGSHRAWIGAIAALIGVAVVLTWFQTREDSFRLVDWLSPVATETATPLPPTPTSTPMRTAVPTKRPQPTPTETAPPPEPTAVRTVEATPAARPTPVPRHTPARGRRAVVPPPVSRPPEPATGESVPPIIDHPRVEATEKPSLGSDLQEATRAYKQAVDAHNARVDEYNALADEVQRRNAWDDSEASVELRRRLERARAAVETARVQAEMLRARMESVRTRYR